MDRVEKEFRSIKDDIYESMQKPKDDISVLKNITKINSINEELQEIIVLLYSNYKSELDLIKSSQYVQATKIIDANLKLINRVKEILNEEQQKQLQPKSNKLGDRFHALPGLVKTAIIGTGIIITLVGLHEIFPDSTEMIFEFVKFLFTSKTGQPAQ